MIFREICNAEGKLQTYSCLFWIGHAWLGDASNGMVQLPVSRAFKEVSRGENTECKQHRHIYRETVI